MLFIAQTLVFLFVCEDWLWNTKYVSAFVACVCICTDWATCGFCKRLYFYHALCLKDSFQGYMWVRYIKASMLIIFCEANKKHLLSVSCTALSLLYFCFVCIYTFISMFLPCCTLVERRMVFPGHWEWIIMVSCVLLEVVKGKCHYETHGNMGRWHACIIPSQTRRECNLSCIPCQPCCVWRYVSMFAHWYEQLAYTFEWNIIDICMSSETTVDEEYMKTETRQTCYLICDWMPLTMLCFYQVWWNACATEPSGRIIKWIVDKSCIILCNP